MSGYYAIVGDGNLQRLVWAERLAPGQFRHTPTAETFTSARAAAKRCDALNCHGAILPPSEAGIETAGEVLA